MTASQAGLLGSLYFLAYGAAQIPAGALTDRTNPRVLLSIGLGVLITGVLLLAVAPTYPVALFSRLFLGVGMGLLFLPAVRLCAGWVGQRRYGSLIGAMVALSTISAPIALLVLPIPLLALGMRLGEGTGAALAAGLVKSAALVHRDMATFAQAGVSTRLPD